ncbi:ricin-type beta-trefoil lectin domain protein [Kineosporia sp. J2-2]|uniref:Ricin-type beta-trefoil lectin domain protein n=1 Tax=Kineosporia corallincola TaxID=2835133 RepID=A0ABS5TS57_9ACTN|nr:RICIN domain-containing protein [Kineosporia corallincola]MBT0773620.1 ricin-type beta-trefoil lectin domain protein [Kineosporia corallincola]
MSSSEPGSGRRPESESEPDEHTEFLSSWKSSMLGRRPVIGVPTRGLSGVVVIGASAALVVGIVIGGVMAVQAFTRSGDGTSDTAALTSAGLGSTTSPSPTATATAEPTATATKDPKKTKTKEAAVPVHTRTVTEEATSTPKQTVKQSEKQTAAQKKKATAAAEKAEKKPGATTASVGAIKNLVTGFCVDLPGYGAVAGDVNVTQYYCDSSADDNQRYETITQADGTFLLREVKSQYCLDVGGSGSVAAGTNVITHACLPGDTDNQMFRKQAQGGGFYLVNVKSGLCLDVSNINNAHDQPDQELTLYTCSPDDDHIWTFTG